MEQRTFLVVLDTTESRTLVQVPNGRGIQRALLNTYIVLATDENHARQVVLSIYQPQIINQIRTSLYVYDLDVVKTNLESIYENKGLPFFAFMPTDGSRPPRQNTNPQQQANPGVSLGNTTLSPNTMPADMVSQKSPQPVQQPRPQQKPVQQQRGPQDASQQPRQQLPPNVNVARRPVGPRTNEFNDGAEASPSTSNNLPPDKMDIIKSLGAIPPRGDTDEGVNNRINASTGVNNNLTRQPVPQYTSDNMSVDKAKLLAGLNLGVIQPPQLDPVFDADVASNNQVFEDPSLATIDDNKVLSDEDLKKIQEELGDKQ